MSSRDRREFVKLLGGVVVATGVAGCSDLPGGGDGDDDGTDTGDGDGDGSLGGGSLPDYASWLPAPTDAPATDPYVLAKIDVAALQEATGDDTPTPTPEETPTATATPGALVRNPLVVLIGTLFGLGFSLSGVGLNDVLKEDGPTDTILLSRAWVLQGDYDVDALAGNVTEAGLSEEGSAGGLTLYVGEDGETAVALGEETVLLETSSDEDEGTPLERVRAIAETGAGSRDDYTTAGDAFTWALSTAGDGGIVFGEGTTDEAIENTPTPTPDDDQDSGFGFPSFANDLYEGVKVGVQSLSFGDQQLSATAALVYPSGGDVPVDKLEAIAVKDSRSADVRTDGNRALIEATFDSDAPMEG